MKRILVTALLAIVTLGALSLLAPAPQASAPCLVCPDIPIPSECPPCYEWVPQTCRQCGHCQKIKGCRT